MKTLIGITLALLLLGAGSLWAGQGQGPGADPKAQDASMEAQKEPPGGPSEKVEKVLEEADKEVPTAAVSPPEKTAGDFAFYKEGHRHLFTIGVMIATTVCLGLVLFMVVKCALPPTEAITAIGLVLVVFGIILLMLIVENERQLTAAIGVFGTIVGYLFGSASKRASRQRAEDQASTEEPKKTPVASS
ncbi:MAG: hypothetical protein PVG03_10875 [Desulfarculaceae bacterium]|jgi:hypothetical protein